LSPYANTFGVLSLLHRTENERKVTFWFYCPFYRFFFVIIYPLLSAMCFDVRLPFCLSVIGGKSSRQKKVEPKHTAKLAVKRNFAKNGAKRLYVC